MSDHTVDDDVPKADLPQNPPTAAGPAEAPSAPVVSAPAQVVDPDVTPKRKSRKAWMVIALVLVAILVGVGGAYGYQQAQTRRTARDKVEQATTLVENADTVVLDVDEVVRAEITSEVGDQALELQDRVPDALENLQKASGLIDDALADLPQEDIARARALQISADTRAEMLAAVDPILEANIKAAASLQPSLDGWEAVLAGEQLADQAVAEYNKLTNDAVKKSQTLTADAEKKYGEAEQLFSEAATGFPEADFGVYFTYVDGKQALLVISKQADEAFLKGDKVKANELGDQYNTKDKELVEQAKKLPDTPTEVVANAYEELAGKSTDAYFDARDKATEADKVLKDLEG